MKAAHSEEMWQLLACGDHSGGGRTPQTNLKVSVRLWIWCKTTTHVRANAGVFYFASNKCARCFEVVAAARHLTETSADCSDKDALQWHPRNTEEDHGDSVGELQTASRWLSWSSSWSSSVREQAHASVSVAACREPAYHCLVTVSVHFNHAPFSQSKEILRCLYWRVIASNILDRKKMSIYSS